MKLHICCVHVSWILLLCILTGSSYSHLNDSSGKHDDSNHIAKSSSCDTFASSRTSCRDTQQIQIKFSTRIVDNEYIVVFKGYYKQLTRENYIGAALNSSGIRNWKILLRNNAAFGLPSDFDIVLLEETDKYHGLNALNNHPLIKRITPQRLVHRSLKFINTTDNSDVPKYRNFKRRINNHVSWLITKILKQDSK